MTDVAHASNEHADRDIDVSGAVAPALSCAQDMTGHCSEQPAAANHKSERSQYLEEDEGQDASSVNGEYTLNGAKRRKAMEEDADDEVRRRADGAGESHEVLECPLCFCEVREVDATCRTVCGHIFCTACLLRSLQYR